MRQFEEQIRSLRIEHEALRAESQAMRRCLDRTGVLPALDVEKEINFLYILMEGCVNFYNFIGGVRFG